ncbi:hypothetical protein Poli38472_003091 [Pythium oligandrum]|uniref:tRNA (guanine(9)-N(1))-methyltransferase n=1 Tax=Pythium oligandrum TaxID=41045 RepID=A0A8K1FCG5_PYTOL|nr:hypothetical protein Poli38472_003091 [Pythium oligandrum]|eukprot:TMW57166.1 hypothetical protein Poli38472_003091 [Pythium oligandrum]
MVDEMDALAADRQARDAAKRQRKKEQRQEMLHSMTLEERRAFVNGEEQKKVDQLERMQQAMADGSGRIKLAIDLGYDHIMNEKEIKSLGKQLKFVYGSIRAMETPFQLRLFHCSEQLRESLARFTAVRWHVHWHDTEEFIDVVSAQDLVYLSPDSPNVLTTLDETKTYVIGGIVDKSRKKGATLQTAETSGITTARLPIQEYITERLDHILNVNTVVDVLIHVSQHGDWKRALTEVLPTRKQRAVGRRSKRRQQLKTQDDDETEKHSDNEEDEVVEALNAVQIAQEEA